MFAFADRYITHNWEQKRALRVQLIAGAVQSDCICSTLRVAMADGDVMFSSGFAHDGCVAEDTPVCFEAAADLHELRALKECILHVDLSFLRHINIL